FLIIYCVNKDSKGGIIKEIFCFITTITYYGTIFFFCVAITYGTFSSKNDLRGHFYQIWVFYIILTCNIRIIIGENIRPCLLNKKMRYGGPDTFLKPFAQI